MLIFSRALSFCLGLIIAAAVALSARAEPVTFTAADNVKIFGTYYGTGDKTKPLVLLFHMAGSNSAEYAPIAPKLVSLGFNALAIDQRSGGTNFGRSNATVKALGRSTAYRQALPDLQAALDWARANGHSGKIIVAGSSYSASLVFLLAAQNQDKIAGVMAFSPGEDFGAQTVRDAAAKLQNVPVFVTSASDNGEIADARAIINAVPGAMKTQLAPKRAPHGASALREDANPRGQAEVWAAVERFLTSLR